MKNFGAMDWINGYRTDIQLDRLRKCGLTDTANPDDYDRDTVRDRLHAMSLVKPTKEEDLMLWWEMVNDDFYGNGVYMVYPVMLAMILKEYDLAEQLIDRGYTVNDLHMEDQIYYEGGEKWYAARYLKLSITQLLMAWTDIPQSLFEKICDELEPGQLQYVSDYWNNPFLMISESVYKREDAPSFAGMDAIWEYRRDLLEEMLDWENRGIRDMIPKSRRAYQNWIQKLTFYFAGMPENLYAMMTLFGASLGMKSFSEECKRNVAIWMGNLTNFQYACSFFDKSRRQFFEYLVTSCHHWYRAHDGFTKKQNEKFLSTVWNLLEHSCPEEYTFADYLEFLQEQHRWEGASELLVIWKQGVKGSLKVRWKDSVFWEYLFGILGEKLDDDDEIEPKQESRNYRREKRIAVSIGFLEQIESVEDGFDAGDEEIRRNLSRLISGILDLESEELLLVCLRTGLIPQETLSIMVRSAFFGGGKRLIPLMLLYQNGKA